MWHESLGWLCEQRRNETYLDELVLTDIYYTEYPDSESNEDVPAFDWGSEVFFIQDFLAPWTT